MCIRVHPSGSANVSNVLLVSILFLCLSLSKDVLLTSVPCLLPLSRVFLVSKVLPLTLSVILEVSLVKVFMHTSQHGGGGQHNASTSPTSQQDGVGQHNAPMYSSSQPGGVGQHIASMPPSSQQGGVGQHNASMPPTSQQGGAGQDNALMHPTS